MSEPTGKIEIHTRDIAALISDYLIHMDEYRIGNLTVTDSTDTSDEDASGIATLDWGDDFFVIEWGEKDTVDSVAAILDKHMVVKRGLPNGTG